MVLIVTEWFTGIKLPGHACPHLGVFVALPPRFGDQAESKFKKLACEVLAGVQLPFYPAAFSAYLAHGGAMLWSENRSTSVQGDGTLYIVLGGPSRTGIAPATPNGLDGIKT